MKKLMIAGVVGLCAAVTFGLESANVVGYQEFNLNEGYGMTTATFAPVNGESISLQNLIPAGDGVGGYGDVVIQVMDSTGSWAGEYAWYTLAATGMPDGWYDTEMSLADATIAYKHREVIGVLDIDSPVKNRFTEDDRMGLEAFVSILEQVI